VPILIEQQKVPLTHKFLFHYSRKGFKGSERLWKFATKFVAYPDQGAEVYLPDGFMMEFDNLDWTSLSIYKGQYEHEVIDFLKLASPNDLFIDVGANIGYTLWITLRNSGARCRAIAIEPSLKCFSRLTRLSGDISHNVKFFNIGLGRELSIGKLYGSTNEKHSGFGSFINRFATNDGVDIDIAALDDLLRDETLGGSPISICKIDTEGYESEVLKGANSTFRTNRPEILLIEISPEFGSINYVNELWQIFDEGYEFVALTMHRGWIRTQPKMRKVGRDEALRMTTQFNLAIIRFDLSERFDCLK
jgi:FkbM family methyltransferase